MTSHMLRYHAGLFCLIALTADADAQNAPAVAAAARRAVVSVEAAGPDGPVTGTGFFVRRDGTFVTNYHVVEGADRVAVTLATGEVYRTVFFVAADADRDIVLLRIPAVDVHPLVLGSDTIVVGDRVYTMSNPLGLDHTFSEGLVSARRISDGVRYLQITAPISVGSSGGPVMDVRGRVVGVATAISSRGQNVNWAVASRYVKALLEIAAAPRQFHAALVPSRSMAPVANSRASRDQEDEWEAESRRQIDEWVELIRGEGTNARLTHEIATGTLEAGRATTIPIDLDAGVEYVVLGACDRDCTDLDLEIREVRGRLIDRDVKSDDQPVVSLTVERSGEFHIVVRMVACEAEPCRYAIGIIREARR